MEAAEIFLNIRMKDGSVHQAKVTLLLDAGTDWDNLLNTQRAIEQMVYTTFKRVHDEAALLLHQGGESPEMRTGERAA
jgi:hypothetical protein